MIPNFSLISTRSSSRPFRALDRRHERSPLCRARTDEPLAGTAVVVLHVGELSVGASHRLELGRYVEGRLVGEAAAPLVRLGLSNPLLVGPEKS